MSEESLPAVVAEAPGPMPVHPAVNSYTVSQLVMLSKMVAGAVALPKALQGKPEDVLAVMLAGRELGIGPMQATRQIEIIQGQTALRAELKLALARRAGHDIRPLTRAPGFVAVHCVTHDSHVVAWARDAEAAGSWVAPAAGPIDVIIASEIMVESWEGEGSARHKTTKPLVDKSNWQSWGFAMLWARACAQLCREHCPEAIGGLYSAEELGRGPVDDYA